MCLSPNEEDFLVGAELLKHHNIKPARLLNKNSKKIIDSDWNFNMNSGNLTRSSKTLIERMRPYQIAYNVNMMNLSK